MGIEEVGTSGRRGLRPWWAHGEAPAVVGTRMQAVMQANRGGGNRPAKLFPMGEATL